MTREQIETEMKRLEREIKHHKSEVYDRVVALEHLKAIRDAMTQAGGD